MNSGKMSYRRDITVHPNFKTKITLIWAIYFSHIFYVMRDNCCYLRCQPEMLNCIMIPTIKTFIKKMIYIYIWVQINIQAACNLLPSIISDIKT